MSLSNQPIVKVRNFFMWILGIIALFHIFVIDFISMRVEITEAGKWKFIWDDSVNSEIIQLIWYVSLVVVIGFVLFEILSRFSSPSFQEDFKERQLFYFLSWFGVIQLFSPYIVGYLDKFMKTGLDSGTAITSFRNIVVALVIIILFRKNLSLIGVNRPNSYRRLILGIVLGYIALVIFVNNLVGKTIQPMLPIELYSSREELIQESAESYLMQTFISGVIIAPIVEELIYRGVFQTYFVKRLGAFIGVLLSSLAFAVMHSDPAVLLVHFSMGIVYGVSRLYTNCIWLPIILHMLNNFFAFISSFQHLF